MVVLGGEKLWRSCVEIEREEGGVGWCFVEAVHPLVMVGVEEGRLDYNDC